VSDHPFGATAFLSRRPDQESHEITLFANPVFAHIAFKVSSLAELRSFHARVVEKKIPIKAVFNHHESFAFYFDDPGGNMIEVYWLTGDLSWRQPYAEPLDLVAARRAAREDNGHALTGNDADMRRNTMTTLMRERKEVTTRTMTKTAPPTWLLAFWKEIDDKTFGKGFDCFAEDAT
jgi:Glyoxalase/Bleomycin resistance protein/Dioxygenase superfamily